jgi:hypothetical protein
MSREFESHRFRQIATVVQWIEQLPSKQWVAGSIPASRAINWVCSLMVKQPTHNRLSLGSIPSRPTSAQVTEW